MKQIQIKVINSVFLSLLVCFSSASYAGKFPAVITPMPYNYELVANRSMLIQSVSKNMITVELNKYAIAAATKIFNSNGESVSASELRKGMRIKIVFDDTQRYLNQPTLSAIYIY